MNARTVAALLFCAATAAPVVALADPPAPLSPPPAAAAAVTPSQGRARRLAAARLVRLSAALGLDDATTVRLGGVLDSYDARLRAARKETRKWNLLLAAYAQGAPATSQDVAQAIDARESARQEVDRIQAERLHALAAVLPADQAAKLVVVLPRVQRQLAREGKARRDRRRPGAARAAQRTPPAAVGATF